MLASWIVSFYIFQVSQETLIKILTDKPDIQEEKSLLADMQLIMFAASQQKQKAFTNKRNDSAVIV